MTPQVSHALKQAGIMIGIAALGAAINAQTDVLQTLNIPAIWWPVIGAALAGAVRWFEGMGDAERASTGDIKPADVGFETVKALEAQRF